jgi:hypothetical protein
LDCVLRLTASILFGSGFPRRPAARSPMAEANSIRVEVNCSSLRASGLTTLPARA